VYVHNGYIAQIGSTVGIRVRMLGRNNLLDNCVTVRRMSRTVWYAPILANRPRATIFMIHVKTMCRVTCPCAAWILRNRRRRYNSCTRWHRTRKARSCQACASIGDQAMCNCVVEQFRGTALRGLPIRKHHPLIQTAARLLRACEVTRQK